MKTDLWNKAEELFNAALSLPQEARGSFLQRECNGETALLSEVQSLLHSFESSTQFLENPVFELGLNAINDTPLEDRSGSTIGPYRLEERIGIGGMGEVYKAIDTRLNRRVALKFLTNALENNKDAKRQLIKEAQAVAMLDHPNICSVHSIEQVEDSHFIAMQFIEGETLCETIASHDTTPEEFRSIARQILSGVAFAHSHGVIHRDLKPGNIMLTPDGTIKVLDFGLAKIIPQKSLLDTASTEDISQFSQAGSIIGTVSYMSPEQLRGEKLDYRSDVFSVGIVLYELLSGRNPFKRDSHAETIAAVLASDPPPLDLSTEFPASYSVIAEKCLAKKREDRFQSAAEILVELDNTETRSPHSARRKFRLALSATVAAIVLAAVLFAGLFFTASPTQRTLAVLPISLDPVLAGKEYLADGLTQSLIEKLSALKGLKVKSEYLVSRFKQKSFNPQSAGKDLGVEAVYSGEIVNRDNSLVSSLG
jgi:serine/threonine protein kinase